ncbi:MAG: hypothetical protein ACSHX5_02615 [Phycisphaerales bacterium]
MNATDHDQFWAQYESRVRPAIQRSCAAVSRNKTDSTMDIDDMIAWIDTKVWRMLRNDQSPTFHDDPSVEVSINRLVTHASTLANWAYLGLCRKHFRRLNNSSQYMKNMSQAQRLAMTSAVDTKIQDRTELDNAIGSLRESLSANEKQKLAASWIDKADRQRIAMVIGATRREDDRMITKTTGGGMNENAVQQMRSRARKRAAQILRDARKLPFYTIATLAILTTSLTTTQATAGEQTGGRRGMLTTQVTASPALQSAIIPGEQTGGRKPK